MAGNSRCPKTFDALLDWLKARWAEEPFPDCMHSRGVFFGKPDTLACPPDAQLSSTFSNASDMTGGSALGAPAENGAFVRWLEQPYATDKDAFYITPLRAAMDRLSKGSLDHEGKPGAVKHLWSVIRLDFDWRTVADNHGWSHDMYGLALAGAIRELYSLYQASKYRVR
jgi:hypothetical protein